MQALDPAKLTATQKAARTELLAGGARIDASIRAATGIQTSITETVSGWWGQAKGLFASAKGALGLGFLPMIAAAAAIALIGSITLWLTSSAWEKLATTGISRSVHEAALDAYQQKIAAGASPEAAAAAAAAVAAALPATSSSASTELPSWVKWGVLGGVAFAMLRTFSRPPSR